MNTTATDALPTIGVLGRQWRASVRPGGTLDVWADPAGGDGVSLAWYVAADDRWHVPEDEVAARQVRLRGTPVVETRVRVPGGDAIHRVYAIADHGGLAIVEVENDSNLPIAVAFSGAALLSQRAPTETPIGGISLPDDAVLFPVGHHATLTVAIAHDGRRPGAIPAALPSWEQVVRGWIAVVERAGRFDVPDAGAVDATVADRCELLLVGPTSPEDDPIDFLLGVDQLVRMTGGADRWTPDVADAVERVLRSAGQGSSWDRRAALDGAARVLLAAGEDRAVRDLARFHTVTATSIGESGLGASPATPARRVAWTERQLARNGDLLPDGFPSGWLGAPIEVHGLPVGPVAGPDLSTAASSVSFALRWHGERPAVLWEVEGPRVELRATAVAPSWSSSEPRGEALWPAPDGHAAPSAAASRLDASFESDGGPSFS